jgi:hypothetical protein
VKRIQSLPAALRGVFPRGRLDSEGTSMFTEGVRLVSPRTRAWRAKEKTPRVVLSHKRLRQSDAQSRSESADR